MLGKDVTLPCSDGLDKKMSFDEIHNTITSNKIHDIPYTLIREVLAPSARDNVTLIDKVAETNL